MNSKEILKKGNIFIDNRIDKIKDTDLAVEYLKDVVFDTPEDGLFEITFTKRHYNYAGADDNIESLIFGGLLADFGNELDLISGIDDVGTLQTKERGENTYEKGVDY